MLAVHSCFLFLFSLVFSNVFAQRVLNLGEGEFCRTSTNEASKCSLLKDCPQIGDFRRNRPTICSFKGIDPVICCPPAPATPATNSNIRSLVTNGNAEKMCNFYTFRSCTASIARLSRQVLDDEEGIRKMKIHVVGGTNAPPKAHKYMVLVGFGAADSKSWNCGGSLISERWVLSAAHCAETKGQGPARWARVGDLDISHTNDDARPQEKMIVQRIIHPNYKEPAVYNDIALFRLDSDVLLNDWVAPICLHITNDIPATKATVTGWGRVDFVGEVSPNLQEVDITLVNGTECGRLYENNKDTKIPQGIDSQTMICAGEREGGKDACSGDSGGPLVITVGNRCIKSQIGITSFGRECGLANTPGVYTKVSYYVPWIESIVWP